MPFRVKNAPATFQRMINRVLGGLEGYQAHIDDIIVYTDDWDCLVKQLHVFLCRLRDNCQLGEARVLPCSCRVPWACSWARLDITSYCQGGGYYQISSTY